MPSANESTCYTFLPVLSVAFYFADSDNVNYVNSNQSVLLSLARMPFENQILHASKYVGPTLCGILREEGAMRQPIMSLSSKLETPIASLCSNSF